MDSTDPVLGVSIESNRLAAGFVMPDGEIIVRDRVSTPSRDVWRTLARLIARVVAALPEGTDAPVGAGVSCAGPVDLRAGTVSPIGWATWLNFPLAEQVATLTGLPVSLAPSAMAHAEGMRWVGDARGASNFAVVTIDATLESSCVVGGRHLHGAHGNAGSLSHIVVDPGGRLCWCGTAGCATAYLAAPLLEQEMNRPLRRAGTAIVERSGMMLGRAVASLAALVDVTTFYVSGHVVDQLGDPFLDIARRELAFRSRLEHLRGLVLVEPEHPVPALVAAASIAFGQVVEPVAPDS